MKIGQEPIAFLLRLALRAPALAENDTQFRILLEKLCRDSEALDFDGLGQKPCSKLADVFQHPLLTVVKNMIF